MENTTLEREAASAPESTVRANINERKFFASMKHLFASSFSVMGELLQNSRRAKASAVRIHADFKTRTLCIEDDGTGIEDFGKLLELSTSGWDNETMLKETPFGMGFFSCFTAAERVEVRSKGKLLKATLDDVINGRTIALEKDATFPPSLTSVTLLGVSKEVMDPDGTGFVAKLKQMVLGFDLPVFLNEEPLDRPHAIQALPGAMTSIGHVSIEGIHKGEKAPVSQYNRRDVCLYLQGLPIETASYGYIRSGMVIHLDSQSFIAKMPDRHALYDSEKQLKRIDQELEAIMRSHLIERKGAMEPSKFAAHYWDAAKRLGMLNIMNDIDFVPKTIFSKCSAAVIRTDYEDSMSGFFPRKDEPPCFESKQFDQGEVHAIMNAPSSASDCAWACAFMKLMQRANISSVDSRDVHHDHWLYSKIAHFDDLIMQVTPNGASDRDESFGWSDKPTVVRLAQSMDITVSVRSESGPDKEIMRHSVFKDWLMVPADPKEEAYEETPVVVWVLGETDESNDHPVNALSTFYSESDTFRDDWENDAKLAWASTVDNLRDRHTVFNVERLMRNQHLTIPERKAGEFGIVRLERQSHREGTYGPPRLAFDPVDHQFMANLTTALIIQTGHKDLDEKQVIRALLSVVRPDLHVGGPRNGDFIGQW